MTLTFNPTELKDRTVAFTYEGEGRLVNVEEVKECNNGNTVIVGRDHNRNMRYRSFNVQKMEGVTVIVQ